MLDTSPQFGPVEIQLNITNLLDEEYISTIGTNGFSAAGDSQTYMAVSYTHLDVYKRQPLCFCYA